MESLLIKYIEELGPETHWGIEEICGNVLWAGYNKDAQWRLLGIFVQKNINFRYQQVKNQKK